MLSNALMTFGRLLSYLYSAASKALWTSIFQSLQALRLTPLAWWVILVVGVLVSPLTRTGPHEASDPIGESSELPSRQYLIIYHILHLS